LILRLFFIAVLFSFFGMSQNGSSVFDKIEDVPIYPGCENIKNKRSCAQTKIQEHIIRNFRYPKEAQKKKIQGRVFVQFYIGVGGYIDNIRTRGPHEILEKEAKRIISLLPRFVPGKIDGEAVRVPMSVPISFRLQ
jgi:TonB family protein